MRTVHEVSRLTGVSIRTLQYYDKIGLLHPAEYTRSGYRLYDDAALEKLRQILLYRELEFPLKDIKAMIESPDFDRDKALEQQITLLTLKKERLESLIGFARGIKKMGVDTMDFTVFDTSRIDQYAAQAKAAWGHTPAYHEYEEKAKGRTVEEQKKLSAQLMAVFTEFGGIRAKGPESQEAQALVTKLQDFITAAWYTCSDQVLAGLGKMYADGADFAKNINSAGGEGTADFVHKAIQAYCGKKESMQV